MPDRHHVAADLVQHPVPAGPQPPQARRPVRERPGPGLTIEGLGGQDDPRTVTRLRASINVACRVAAGDRRTSYYATDERITIGIAGPDARERIAGLRRQLARIGRNRGWTITEDLS